MSHRFFITGLPRSRTAWFSVAATTPSSVCVHEPTATLASFQQLRDLWVPRYGIDFGVSDSSLASMAPRILSELKPRTLIIDRPVEDCVRSYAEYAARHGMPFFEAACTEMARRSLVALDTVRDHPLVCTVAYDALHDHAVMYRAMEWILPGREFPDLRQLMAMNIQVNDPEPLIAAAGAHTGWHLEPEVTP